MSSTIGIGAAALGAGLAGAASLGDTFANWGISSWLNQQSNEMDLNKMAQQYAYDKSLWDLQAQFNSAEAQKSRDWQEKMSNTAYQRAIADMQQAGINPASLGGAQMSSASTPSSTSASASLPSVGTPSSSSAHFTGSNMSGVLGSLANSAVYGVFAKDRQASRELANEIRDNAKHAYRMQEINERISGNKAVQVLRNSSNELIAENRNQNITNNKKLDRELMDAIRLREQNANDLRVLLGERYKENFESYKYQHHHNKIESYPEY